MSATCFSRSDAEVPALYTLIDEQDGVYLYKNNKTLPAGFITGMDRIFLPLSFLKRPPDPFEVQKSDGGFCFDL